MSAHDQIKRHNHQQRRASPMDTKTTSTPATPIPVGQRAKMITCLCFVNTLAMPAAQFRSRDIPGEARSLDGRSPFPNRKYSPSESESANYICNKSSQYNFLLVIWAIFSHKSHNLLTSYELNFFRINDTIAHLPCYFLEHFWSRIEVCHLVVGNTSAILHDIRN